MAFWPKKTDNGAASGAPVQSSPNAAAPMTTPMPPASSSAVAHSPAAQAQTGQPAQPELSDEQKRKNANSSKMIAAAFGEIVALLMRTPAHKDTKLADLEWLVAPAVATGQFTIAEAQMKANGITQPMGVVLWAKVSPEVDKRLQQTIDQPLKLTPQEWASGDIIWLIEVAGEPRVLDAVMKRMRETVWSGKTVRVRGKDKDGKSAVGTLSSTPPTAKA
jgi:hemolysin-activating ACP:hemolysin acyltransferase